MNIKHLWGRNRVPNPLRHNRATGSLTEDPKPFNSNRQVNIEKSSASTSPYGKLAAWTSQHLQFFATLQPMTAGFAECAPIILDLDDPAADSSPVMPTGYQRRASVQGHCVDRDVQNVPRSEQRYAASGHNAIDLGLPSAEIRLPVLSACQAESGHSC